MVRAKFFFFCPLLLLETHALAVADKILYALIARGQTSLVDYSVREGNHVLLAQQILAKAKQDTVRGPILDARSSQENSTRCRVSGCCPTQTFSSPLFRITSGPSRTSLASISFTTC